VRQGGPCVLNCCVGKNEKNENEKNSHKKNNKKF
jgi:hypothetical protein